MAGPRAQKKAEGGMAAPKAASAPAAAPAPTAARPPEVMQKIALTAYHLWEKRGRPHGSSSHDWLEAERIVLGRKS